MQAQPLDGYVAMGALAPGIACCPRHAAPSACGLNTRVIFGGRTCSYSLWRVIRRWCYQRFVASSCLRPLYHCHLNLIGGKRFLHQKIRITFHTISLDHRSGALMLPPPHPLQKGALPLLPPNRIFPYTLFSSLLSFSLPLLIFSTPRGFLLYVLSLFPLFSTPSSPLPIFHYVLLFHRPSFFHSLPSPSHPHSSPSLSVFLSLFPQFSPPLPLLRYSRVTR